MNLDAKILLLVVGALLLTTLWSLLAWWLVRLTRLQSPLARLIVFLAPLLAAYGTLPRLMPEARAEILLTCIGIASLFGLRDLINYYRYRTRLLSDCLPYPEAERVCPSLVQQLGISPVPVYRSDRLGSGPIVLGLRRPAVIFPAWITDRLDHDEIRVLIAHELGHIVRRDLVWKWVLLYLRRLAFWNPVAAWPYKWISTEIEFACDRIACRLTDKPGTLARTLCKVAQLQADRHGIATARPSHIPAADIELQARINFLASQRLYEFDWQSLMKTAVILTLFYTLCFRPAEMILALL